ncbi:nucleoside-triphosphatase-like [Gastrolobium bilobum]|uniref:nucleoside-triphosphatase-like n=1 Tax=Gastrolobium bilobum TaxID=150636 RepID=UPI002AB0EE27|nr:nucleoside-triphosphatase-like [Gastrolobium bilobum]
MRYLIHVTLLLSFMLATASSSSLYHGNGNYLFTNRKMSNSFPNQEAINESYAVVFDAGSTGSRVHVFRFNQRLDLLRIGEDLELFVATEPGLSAYEKNPQEAAQSLVPLLEEAESVVPEELQPRTPLQLGATAGLRLLEGDAAEKILEAVRDMFEKNSTFKVESDAVSVLGGSQEGAYMWVAINYLLGKLGKPYSKTAAVVDLGGGSVQMAYALSEKDAEKAPNAPDGTDPYITQTFVSGKKYYLYVHSYLGFGQLAARAGVLNITADSNSPCILAGFNGNYTYNGVDYNASALPSGSSFSKCKQLVLKSLNVNETCTHKNCTFGGIWNGGGGKGQTNFWVASFFYDMAKQAGFIDSNAPNAKVRPVDFKTAAELACKTTLKDVKSTFPLLEDRNLPYICLDLTYQHTLLVDGFGLDPWKEITLVTQIEYQNSLVGAAWPLGTAIEAVSSLPKFDKLVYFI